MSRIESLSAHGWQTFMNMLALRQENKYNEAEILMNSLSDEDKKFSKIVLFNAYIHRAKGEYVSLINELLRDFSYLDNARLYTKADACSILANTYNSLGEGNHALEWFLNSSQFELEAERWSSSVIEYSNAIFSSVEIEDFSSADVMNLYNGYSELLSLKVKPYQKVFYNHAKIRIGYLSSDFHQHPVSNFVYPLLAHYSQADFDVYCYSASSVKDFVTEAINKLPVIWRECNDLSDAALAELIHNDEIDILVDLGGHTANNRVPVLAYAPATIQVSAIGWVGSTGLKETDYVLGDKFCVKSSVSPFYTEKLWALPHTHFCYHEFYDKFPAVNSASCLKNNYITFGCFNNFAKITDSQLRLWSRILLQVPGSRLILKHKVLGYSEGRTLALERMEKAGISADRIELRGFSADYLQQYNDVDIALDTFPYVGGMTTFEALYMGVPVISRYGEHRGTRFGYSLLCNAGLEVLTAADEDDYVAKAVELASDMEVIAGLRQQLRDMVRNSPLMDEKQYVLDVETAYKDMYGFIF